MIISLAAFPRLYQDYKVFPVLLLKPLYNKDLKHVIKLIMSCVEG